jgi:hypothetical protein
MTEYTKPRDFTYNPNSPKSINEAMLICSNNIATIGEILAKAEDDKARAEAKYKVEYAKAFLSASGSSEKCKSYALVSDEVQEAQMGLNVANAKARLLKAHYDGWDSIYNAVRKSANIWESENNKSWGRQ